MSTTEGPRAYPESKDLDLETRKTAALLHHIEEPLAVQSTAAPTRDLPDLSRRTAPADLPEFMDEHCTRADLQTCLQDLAWVNRTLFGYRPTLHWLESLNLSAPSEPIRILDVGCGYGDTLRCVEQWTQRKGIAVNLTGLDLNTDATSIAAEASPATSQIRWVNGNVFDYAPPHPPHLILSSLFTHHLSDPELVRFLEWMENNAVTGWFINDLSRDITPYRLFSWFSRLTRLHPFVQHDGPVSFARAFVPEDWQRYCAAAGLAAGDVEIRAFTPGRLCVSRRKPQ
jgi:SAM-dependent methyltransferase